MASPVPEYSKGTNLILKPHRPSYANVNSKFLIGRQEQDEVNLCTKVNVPIVSEQHFVQTAPSQGYCDPATVIM